MKFRNLVALGILTASPALAGNVVVPEPGSLILLTIAAGTYVAYRLKK